MSLRHILLRPVITFVILLFEDQDPEVYTSMSHREIKGKAIQESYYGNSTSNSTSFLKNYRVAAVFLKLVYWVHSKTSMSCTSAHT